jgi:predicted tellurium resistance membrane protein TerC
MIYEWWLDGAALASLIALELVLGVDNLIVLEALVERLKPALRQRVWYLGLTVAVMMRVALLWTVSVLSAFTEPWFWLGRWAVSPHAVLLGSGGFFLVFKATQELLNPERKRARESGASAGWIFIQIVAMDLVLSLDSVYTAVGLSQSRVVMAGSIVIAGSIVLLLRTALQAWISRSENLQRLVWGLLLVIGASLISEAVAVAMPKWILYVLIATGFVFNAVVSRRKRAPTEGS